MKIIMTTSRTAVTAVLPVKKRILVTALAATISASAQGAQWDTRTFLDVGAISDDNILLSTGPHESTSGYVAAGRIETSRKTETSNATVNGYLARTTYRQGSIEDKTDLRLALNGENRTSERGTVGLDGEYRREALFETVVIQQGTGDIRDTDVGLTTSTQVRRNYMTFQPWWNWLLTELSAIRLSYRLTDASFSNETGTGLFDYRDNLLSATYSRQFTPRDEWLLTTNVAQYRPEGGGNDVDTLQLLTGVGRRFTENTHGAISAGVSRSTAKIPTGDEASSGFVATASLRQKSELSEFEGVVSRDVTPSGAGRALSTDQLRLWWSRRLSEELDFVLDAQLFRNKALKGGDPGVDRHYYEIAPQLRWRWLENLFVTTTYRYRQQKYDAQSDSADSNAVFLGLSYAL